MLDFPNSPTVNQIFTAGATSWKWDGIKWLAAASGADAGGTPVLPLVIVVTASITLSTGFTGYVRVENGTSGPITIILPLLPVAGQEINIKDCLGNAATYPITIGGNGKTIEGAPSLVIRYGYGWADLMYTGVQWVQV